MYERLLRDWLGLLKDWCLFCGIGLNWERFSIDFEVLGRGIGEGLVWDWLGIAEGLVSILRDWSKLGEAFVWVF